MIENNENKKQDFISDAHEIFSKYLEINGYRKTLERFAVLDAAWNMNGHFTAESLFDKMKSDFHISLATVYGTLDLLVKCNIFVCHNIHDKMEFEKMNDAVNHVHLVCLQCGSVREFKFGYIHKLIEGHIFRNFKSMNHVLYVYGVCNKCQAYEAKVKKINKKK